MTRIITKSSKKRTQWNNELDEVLLQGSIIVSFTLSILMRTSLNNSRY